MKIEINNTDFDLDEKGHFPERKRNPTVTANPTEFRRALIDWIQHETVGPNFENYQSEEYLKLSPNQIYCAGILYPQMSLEPEIDIGGDSDPSNAHLQTSNEQEIVPTDTIAVPVIRKPYEESAAEEGDDELTLANSYRQAAIGLSFVVAKDAESFVANVFASAYEAVTVEKVCGKTVQDERERPRFQRKPIDLPPLEISLLNGRRVQEIELGDYKLKLRCRVRTRVDGTRLITLSMYNTFVANEQAQIQYRQCFYQCGLSVTLREPFAFLPYDGLIQRNFHDPEELQLRLLYRDRRGYALGHGCAVQWDNISNHPTRLITSPLPSYRVPPVVPKEADGQDCFAMTLYSSLSSKSDQQVIELLTKLPNQYRIWLEKKDGEIASLSDDFTQVAKDKLKECWLTLSRIEAGITLLERNPKAMLAFRLMNRAMISQQLHYAREKRNGPEDYWEELPVDGRTELKPHQGWWRVFQLGFILANLNGSHRSLDLEERELVDLIWFPTGGGKTEAYLGLSAFAIFYRRLLNPTEAGCTVLMRYTLRLLTVQQFERAAAMICACDQIRSESPALLGEESISIGMWVGFNLTPNKRQGALHSLSRMFNPNVPREDRKNQFQLLKCPWCGTSLEGNSRAESGYKQIQGTVKFECREARCDFSDARRRPLPVLVIDEDIYQSPPTLIIGTVDKFATMAWNGEAGKIFGHGTKNSPPELIIQDELHLISGPVGTMVGLYECVIDLLCQDSSGRGAKIVGSTATIRRAAAQCRALYNREVVQFPPSGISAADNFFSFEDTGHAGRIYLGICPLSASSFVTGIVRTFSSVLEGAARVNCLEEKEEEIRDGYWTLIQYYNSLRELGRALTLMQQDIPEWGDARAKTRHESARKIYQLDELTSRKTAEEIPRTLEDLKITWRKNPEAGRHKRPFDSVLATNMISVGVDIDRLGVMAIVGQPKSTSEYIQASSRVGRKNHPGLVLACYNPAKPRDRSHFESFTRYHSSLYRWVEPTSVTPFSIPALDKALHALLIIIARHLLQVHSPNDFSRSDARLQKYLDYLTNRCREIEVNRDDRADEVSQRLEAIADKWIKQAPTAWRWSSSEEHYVEALMVNYSNKNRARRAFVTPESLRGVDDECEIAVARPVDLSGENTNGESQ